MLSFFDPQEATDHTLRRRVQCQKKLLEFMPHKMLKIILATLAVSNVMASNPFSSNVIALTPHNFKELENSPHVWFVNVCRQS